MRGIGETSGETLTIRNSRRSCTRSIWCCCIERFGLSRREAEVVVYLAAGWTNPEIAAELWLSPRTVARHVTRICDKVGARTRAGVVGSVVLAALLDDRWSALDADLEPAGWG